MDYAERCSQGKRSFLAMLQEAERPLGSLVLTKLFFLLRHEADLARGLLVSTILFPYKFGPYSFALSQ